MTHQHNYFLATTKTNFLPLENGTYELVEYAYLICKSCSQVVKQEIKAEEKNNE